MFKYSHSHSMTARVVNIVANRFPLPFWYSNAYASSLFPSSTFTTLSADCKVTLTLLKLMITYKLAIHFLVRTSSCWIAAASCSARKWLSLCCQSCPLLPALARNLRVQSEVGLRSVLNGIPLCFEIIGAIYAWPKLSSDDRGKSLRESGALIQEVVWCYSWHYRAALIRFKARS